MNFPETPCKHGVIPKGVFRRILKDSGWASLWVGRPSVEGSRAG